MLDSLEIAAHVTGQIETVDSIHHDVPERRPFNQVTQPDDVRVRDRTNTLKERTNGDRMIRNRRLDLLDRDAIAGDLIECLVNLSKSASSDHTNGHVSIEQS